MRSCEEGRIHLHHVVSESATIKTSLTGLIVLLHKKVVFIIFRSVHESQKIAAFHSLSANQVHELIIWRLWPLLKVKGEKQTKAECKCLPACGVQLHEGKWPLTESKLYACAIIIFSIICYFEYLRLK